MTTVSMLPTPHAPSTSANRASAWLVLCLLAFVPSLAGCDSSPDKPSKEPKSRVQAVVQSAPAQSAPAQPEADSQQAKPTPTGPTIGTGTGAPKLEGPQLPKRPRPPLCAGQTSDNGSPFNPKRAPEQRAASGAANLPEDPITGKGERWTWVNFWAAWCKPCKEELPILLQWQKELHGQLDFAFISFDDDQRQLDTFLQEQPETGLKKSYWLPDGGARLAWLKTLNLEVEPELPMQLLLDPRGRLRCTVQGAIDASDVHALKQIVSGP